MCRPCPLTEKPLWQELEMKHFVSGTSSARWDLLRYNSSHLSLVYMSNAFYTPAQCFTKFGHVRQKNLNRELECSASVPKFRLLLMSHRAGLLNLHQLIFLIFTPDSHAVVLLDRSDENPLWLLIVCGCKSASLNNHTRHLDFFLCFLKYPRLYSSALIH